MAIAGKLDKREDGIRLVANEIGPIAGRKSVKALTIDIPMEKADEERLIAIRDLVRQFPGDSRFIFDSGSLTDANFA